MASAVARKAPAFKLGKKQIFLPNHVITLVRKEAHPADWATFQVPIRFTKFDLRDYLFNLYNIEVRAVRSWVRRQVAPIKNDAGRFMRPPAEKYMTVEMTQPFVWPETPADRSPWDGELHSMREKMMKDQDKIRTERYKGNIPLASDRKLERDDQRYRKLARELLEGKKKWENGVVLDEKWDALTGKKETQAAVVEEVAEDEGKKKN
ncbi:related to ribosomal protein [Cephalotrichum gorgonifer]|uniref:Large ribosomal subunit protein uL23m n=1 Tax=Cephalotrichum gorgonifer TaxID=2041049 RepID=A0AAE8MSD2_9PEZI|nr:related to ribosomal protein [Cephalotrichum gorgonifer]